MLSGIPLVAWRQRRALSQRDLARLSGVGLATIVRIEHGQQARPSTVRRLARSLDVTPEELIEGPPQRSQRAEEGS
jgi:transcriptional regulator with XRE-family HTH domain